MPSRMSPTTRRCVSTRSEIEPGNSRKYGVTPYGTHRKHRHAERLGGVGRHAFGQDAVDREPQVAVLLGAAERQHGAVVVPQVFFHLHPVHVGNAHVDLQSVVDCRVFANSGFERSAELREPVQHDRDVVCAEARTAGESHAWVVERRLYEPFCAPCYDYRSRDALAWHRTHLLQQRERVNLRPVFGQPAAGHAVNRDAGHGDILPGCRNPEKITGVCLPNPVMRDATLSPSAIDAAIS